MTDRLARHGVPTAPQELRTHEWIVFSSTERLDLRGPDGEVVELSTTGRVRCDDMLFVLNAVRCGAGLGVLPTFLAERELVDGALVQVLPWWTASGGRVWVVTPAGRNAARAVAAFIAVVKETFAARRLTQGR